jgi:hypothetical protein
MSTRPTCGRKHFARALKDALDAAKVSHHQLAESLGYSRSTAYRRLNGTSPVYLIDYEGVARLTGRDALGLLADAFALAEAESHA